MATFRMVLGNTDNINLTATPSKALGRSYSDSVNTTSSMGNRPKKSLAEAVAALSVLARNVVAVRALTEALEVADGDTEHFVRKLAEQISGLDVATKGPSLAMDIESVPLQESSTRLIGVVLAETLTPTEQVVFCLSCHLADQGVLADEATTRLSLSALTESLPLADIAARAVLKAQNEAIALNDALSRVAAFIRALAQTVGLSDGDAEHFAHIFEDAVQASDVVGRSHLRGALAEMLSLTETKNIASSRALQDNPALTEEIFRAAAKLFVDDYLPLSDGLARVLTILKAWDEVLSTGDRLRIGGVWSDPTTKIMALILKAALNTQIEKVETP